MINEQRGDTLLIVNGKDYVLRLTLGALAKIESWLSVKTVGELIERFQNLGFRDLTGILMALIQGSGQQVTQEEVDNWPYDFNRYLEAITECLKRGGFLRMSEGGEDEKK